MKVSLCVTTYNRGELCIESFKDIMDDERVDDIVIVDDHSTDGSDSLLRLWFAQPKPQFKRVRIFRQGKNAGMATNKKDAVALAKNEWCIILDDDNKISKEYLDALKATPDLFSEPNEIYLPDFAMPNFDYTHFSGLGFKASNIKEVCNMPMFGALLNTCNYVVNKKFYCNTWQYNPEMKATDTVWHALQHLKAGGSFYVVPGMQYEHRVHPESGFMKDVDYNMDQAIKLENLIKAL